MRGKSGVTTGVLVLVAATLSGTEAQAVDCTRTLDAGRRLECLDHMPRTQTVAPQDRSDQEKIRAAVRGALKDPASAQFGPLRVFEADGACQTVNARNSYGGYTGEQQAVMSKVNGQWLVLALASVSQRQCLALLKQSKQPEPPVKEEGPYSAPTLKGPLAERE
jgi:hypothetical protein